jgi:hypothetical protein
MSKKWKLKKARTCCENLRLAHSAAVSFFTTVRTMVGFLVENLERAKTVD